MAKSGYVLAGFETLSSILNNFIIKSPRYKNNFTRDDIANFLSTSLEGFLHSYGQNFAKRKSYNNYNQKEQELLQKCRETGFFDKTNFIVDSGGFQISIGRLNRKESELLFDLYYQWLYDAHNVYDRAFILDVPPGPNCKIFRNFDDVYDFNLRSYITAAQLPEKIRKKIIYIHHFRTPMLWRIYTKILHDEGMFSKFQRFGTGGIVANSAGDSSIPCIIYVLPLVPLLKEAKQAGYQTLKFHILGGASLRDIFLYKLFEKHILKEHGITLKVSYDSSGIFKQVMIGRFIFVKDMFNNYSKLDLRSKKLHLRYEKETVYDKLECTLNVFANKWNFQPISLDGVYNSESKTFWDDIRIYLMLYTLGIYADLEEQLNKLVDEIYLYYNTDEEKFYQQCLNITKMLNGGKISKKQRIKSQSIIKSLRILSELNESFCEHLINKYLSKDEFVDLDTKSKILTI